MIYAYGICPRDAVARLPRRRGLGGARLRALPYDELAAVYSAHRTLRPQPTPSQVLAHERIVEAIMADGPVLPLRFGTLLEAEERLAAVLEERRDELLRGLERVRGRVELGVRALPAGAGARAAAPESHAAGEAGSREPVPASRAAAEAGARASAPESPAAAGPPAPSSGRAYLLARAAQQRGRDRAARELHAPLAELAVKSVVRERPAPPAVLVASYLVEADRVAAFHARAAQLAARGDALDVVVTGPWPPYSFVAER